MVLAGCDLGTGSDADPATVTVVPAFVDLDAIGGTVSLTAEVRNEDYARARRLAEQSAADSQVAIARSRAAVADQTYQAAQQSMDVLQQTAPAPAAGPVPLTR